MAVSRGRSTIAAYRTGVESGGDSVIAVKIRRADG